MSTTDDLKARLAALDADFKEAPKDGGSIFDPPPPGKYQTIFREVDHFEPKQGTDWFLKLIFQVSFGEYESRRIEKVYNMGASGSAEARQQRMGFLKQDLETLGVDTEAPGFSVSQCYPGSDLWDSLLGTPVEIAMVESKKINPSTDKPYLNAYLNERLGDPLPTDLPPDPLAAPLDTKPTDDDDIPF